MGELTEGRVVAVRWRVEGGSAMTKLAARRMAVVEVRIVDRGGSDRRLGAFQHFMGGGGDPRGPMTAFNPSSGAQYVVDTGSFYTATARLGALAWEWATRPGSPYLYRLDAVRLHAEWKAYCDTGIDYLRERVFPWYAKMVNARNNGGADNMIKSAAALIWNSVLAQREWDRWVG